LPYFKYNEKKVYYSIEGAGEPLLLIHGNSVSSKMFSPVLKYYTSNFRVILMDLPGHGKSARLYSFPKDFWYENAMAVHALLKHLELPPVNVIGTSGGALIALNLILEHPESVKALIADSFEGTESIASFADNVHILRAEDKKKFFMRLYWLKNHGLRWKGVVDNDSEAIYAHHMEIKKFFHRDLSEIKKPLLLTGSLEDQFLKEIIVDLYADLKATIKKCRSHYFYTGSHPAMITSGEEFAKVAADFFNFSG
jgi:pimeloyl-ACP methyl ester carboxylesterase